MNLVERLDELRQALELELGARQVVQAVMQREGGAGSAGVVHEQTVEMVVVAARRLIARRDAA